MSIHPLAEKSLFIDSQSSPTPEASDGNWQTPPSFLNLPLYSYSVPNPLYSERKGERY